VIPPPAPLAALSSRLSSGEIGVTGAVVVVMVLIYLWVKYDSERELARAQRRKSRPHDDASAAELDPAWRALVERAEPVVRVTMAELPDDVRAEAESVPVLYEERSEQDGEGRALLGLYRHFEEGRVARSKGPIVLYLRTIERFAGDAGGAFEKEVRETYLHELGHHLGWGEGEVRERGL
jgi:predicted Zn-dependent protease with MMP-like domain